MSDLKTKYHRLINNIYKYFIFYIPSSVLADEDREGLFATFFDKLIVIDNLRDTIDPAEIDLIRCFQQASNLTDNAFKIVKYKKSLLPIDFNFIVDKYFEQVRCYARIAEVLLEYYDVNCPKKNADIKNAFIYQCTFLKNHLAEIEKIIETKSVQFDDREIVDYLKKSDLFDKLKKDKKDVVIIYFRDHIIHDKKEEIEKILIEKYRNIKGIKIRYLIDYFQEIGLLSIYHGKRKEIYESLKKSFDWNIGHYNSIFGFEQGKVANPDYESFKKELNNSLQNFIS